jgi:hypothetical protein
MGNIKEIQEITQPDTMLYHPPKNGFKMFHMSHTSLRPNSWPCPCPTMTLCWAFEDRPNHDLWWGLQHSKCLKSRTLINTGHIYEDLVTLVLRFFGTWINETWRKWFSKSSLRTLCFL